MFVSFNLLTRFFAISNCQQQAVSRYRHNENVKMILRLCEFCLKNPKQVENLAKKIVRCREKKVGKWTTVAIYFGYDWG